jgi:phenylacetate-CoA ligase
VTLPLVASAVSGLAWPAVPHDAGAAMLAAQFQLGDSEWWDSARIERHQFRQLQRTLAACADTVPHVRSVLSGMRLRPQDVTGPDALARFPVLTRRDLQLDGDRLHARSIPDTHQPVVEGHTSGSTGMPVRFRTTAVNAFFFHALGLREVYWHRRAIDAPIAVIRHGCAEGDVDGWGPETDAVHASGMCSTLSINTPVDEQLAWLCRKRPRYVLTFPTNLRALIDAVARGACWPDSVVEVRTVSEALDATLRADCQRHLGAVLTDVYSAQEVGYLALQCPDHPHYHVQSETLILEVLRDDGSRCGVGETGRVVVTTLHNLAMPLLRYEIGDLAEVGPTCPCGRGLPVLTRIHGRVRNRLRYPDGRITWPTFARERLEAVVMIRQMQVIQPAPDRLDVKLVVDRALTPAEEATLRAILVDTLGFPFGIAFHRVDRIPRSPAGKFEDFRCELPG